MRSAATPQDRMLALQRMINGYQLSQAIGVAATLGIADLLADGARTSAELASHTGSHAPTLHRLLRALAAAGIFHEDGERRFSLTWLGEGLRDGVPGSRRAWARYSAGPPAWLAWGQLLHSVQTGENAFRHAHGVDVWRYRAENTSESALFDAAMRESSEAIAACIAGAYDFAGLRRVVDVGGGDGTLLARLVAGHPWMSGTLIDQAHVVAAATEVFRHAGVGERCVAVAASFFDAVPAGDVHILKFILHNWEDADAVAILRRCRRSIAPHGRLLVVERTLAGANDGIETKFADLNMLVHPGGRERTRDELSGLLAAGGFHLTRVIPLIGEVAMIEGDLGDRPPPGMRRPAAAAAERER